MSLEECVILNMNKGNFFLLTEPIHKNAFLNGDIEIKKIWMSVLIFYFQLKFF